MSLGIHIGTVVGNTSPQEFRFFLKSFTAKLGDLVAVRMEIPSADGKGKDPVLVWGRIVELGRFNPFLPVEAGQELAQEGLNLLDTVLSLSRDQVEGKVLVLGQTPVDDIGRLRPLSYPVSPGAEVKRPPAASVKTILTGDKPVHRLRLGTLIGRPDVEVRINTNVIVARHMAILAMTGGGKTVAARRIIKELLEVQYPLVILDPHGDYLGLWEQREGFPKNSIHLFYPSLTVREENLDLVGYLIAQMTQGFTDPQKEKYREALERIDLRNKEVGVVPFIEKLLQKLEDSSSGDRRTAPTIRAVKRGFRLVRSYVEAMEKSNERLRRQAALQDFPFKAMPDPSIRPEGFVRPGQASIVYLGGYDHLTQSTIVAVILKELFEHRASMRNQIPPFLAVVEEAHNFIPSRGEGQAGTPSVEIIKKVITEGRKFGTGLLLVSQRPSRLDETALSQCNTFLIFRLVNPRDQSFVEKVMENLSKADSRLLPGFGPGQGIVSGQAVRFPLVIKVDFDRELQTQAIGDENFLEATKKWQESPEAKAADRTDNLLQELDGIEDV
ncbi:MAG: ATP-binding protein [Acidobacteriota bacterium]|nr:ATP-binding protein [Acidobacteriota bacterium]